MRRLDRYMLRELLVPFFTGTLAVVLMFQANTLIFMFKNFQLNSVSFTALLQIILYHTPSFLILTLPVGMSLAASLAVTRLARESELTVIRAAGVPLFRTMLPIMFFGVLVSLANFYIGERVSPTATKLASKREREIAIQAALPDFQANIVIPLKEYVALFGAVSSQPDGTILLNDILLFNSRRPGETVILNAKSGQYKEGEWRIFQPYLRVIKGEDIVQAAVQNDLIINEKIFIPDLFSTPQPEEQTTKELLENIRMTRARGNDSTKQEVSYHQRFAVPASCFVFALVAPIFAIRFSRSGAFTGVLLSIILVFLYYNAFAISTGILGPSRLVAPWLAAWLPNIIFVVLGIIGIRRLE